MIIPWTGIAKVKEEVFKNGTSVSITVYKRVGERGLHRSWVVYRDDLPGFDSAGQRDAGSHAGGPSLVSRAGTRVAT